MTIPPRSVTCELPDALRFGFPSSPPSRYFDRDRSANFQRAAVKDTVVADAAKYYGVVPLQGTATLGDFSVNVASIFTALVPSAQTEIPIVDANPHGDTLIYSAAGAPFTFTTTGVWSATAAIAIGQAALPGSITITAGATALTERAGRLFALSPAARPPRHRPWRPQPVLVRPDWHRPNSDR